MGTQSAVKERGSTKLQEPKQYNVVMYNDDFTTMEFVVAVLTEIFHKDPVSAETIMLTVHRQGKATVGTYPYDIAVTRVRLALRRAKNSGFPFRIEVVEA